MIAPLEELFVTGGTTVRACSGDSRERWQRRTLDSPMKSVRSRLRTQQTWSPF